MEKRCYVSGSCKCDASMATLQEAYLKWHLSRAGTLGNILRYCKLFSIFLIGWLDVCEQWLISSTSVALLIGQNEEQMTRGVLCCLWTSFCGS